MSRSGWPTRPGRLAAGTGNRGRGAARAWASGTGARLGAGAGRGQRGRGGRGQRGHRDRDDLAPQPRHLAGRRDAALVGLGVDPGDLGGAVAAVDIGRAHLAAGARRRRDVGRRADQPPVVHPGLAGRRDRRGFAVRHLPGLPGPDQPGHRGRAAPRCRTPRRSLASRTARSSPANTVWVLSSYSGSSVVLTGYNGKTLAPAGTVTVPVSGQVSSAPQGVLTSGPGGDLYVAAGSAVAVVNPAHPPGGQADRHARAGQLAGRGTRREAVRRHRRLQAARL